MRRRAWLLGDAHSAASSGQQASTLLRALSDQYWQMQHQAPAEGSSSGSSAASTSDVRRADTARALVRLLRLFGDQEAGCSAVLGRLQQALAGAYDRPYQSSGEVDSGLLLLLELLSVVSSKVAWAHYCRADDARCCYHATLVFHCCGYACNQCNASALVSCRTPRA